jgi:glycosyltransferase involved in cell wall biosynthesis
MYTRNTVNVSVIIPTYNRAVFLVDTLNSVFSQTVGVREVIVVDDGSTDNTKEIVGSYGNKVRYVYQENKGVSAARNHGISLATSKYIAFLDSDDQWLPEKIEQQYTELEQDSELVAHVCNISWFRGNKTFPQQFFTHSGMPTKNEQGVITSPLEWVIRDSVAVIQALMVRTDKLHLTGLFDPELSLWEDTDFAARLALAGPWAYTSRPFVLVRDPVEGDDRLSRPRETEYSNSLITRYSVLSSLLSNSNLKKDNDRKVLQAELARTTYALAGLYARTGALKEASRFYRDSFRYGFRFKSLFMLITLLGSFGGIHRILGWYKSRTS